MFFYLENKCEDYNELAFAKIWNHAQVVFSTFRRSEATGFQGKGKSDKEHWTHKRTHLTSRTQEDFFFWTSVWKHARTGQQT